MKNMDTETKKELGSSIVQVAGRNRLQFATEKRCIKLITLRHAYKFAIPFRLLRCHHHCRLHRKLVFYTWKITIEK